MEPLTHTLTGLAMARVGLNRGWKRGTALLMLAAASPDIVLMDIELPRMSGIECTARLRELCPDAQIMILTVYEDDDKVFKSLVAGATGYLLKRTPPAALLESLRVIHEGGSPMSDQIARKVVEAFQQMGKTSAETENLSEREENPGIRLISY